MFRFLIDYLDEWRVKHPILRFWAGPFPIFMIYTAEAAEVQSNNNRKRELFSDFNQFR